MSFTGLSLKTQRWRVMGNALLALGGAELASGAEGRPQTCTANCVLPLQRVTVVDGRFEDDLVDRPRRAVRDQHGRIFLISFRSAAPTVFDSGGHYLGSLGAAGSGPGETRRATWIDASIGDSIRVFAQERIVVFSPDLKHVRTTTVSSPVPAMYAAFLDPRYHAIQSAAFPDLIPRVNPILIRTESGRVLHRIEIPWLGGGLTRTAFTRDVTRRDALWLVESQETAIAGYRVARLTLSGQRLGGFERLPTWWQGREDGIPPQAKLTSFPMTPWTFIKDVRQIGPALLAVLIATPRSDWRAIALDSLTNEGFWNRLETVLEVVDVRRNMLVGTARSSGAPVSLVADDAFAVTEQDREGYPKVTILRFRRP